MKALDNKCPSCSASINYDPKKELWHCEYCDSDFTLEELNKRSSNASSEENNKIEESIDVDSYTCKNCGATVMADTNTASTFCVYCGNTTILKNKLTGIYAPKYIIPFKNTKDEIIENFKGLQKGRPLMPKFFNNPKNIDKITGIYIPFWLFDIGIKGNVVFTANRVTSWTSGNYEYTKTDYYELERGADLTFNKIPADGSSRFDDKLMQSLEPFEYKKMEKYNHAYLSGFLAEKYDVGKEETEKIVKERAINTTLSMMRSTCSGYSAVLEKNLNLNNNTRNVSYVLLPVLMLNVNYRGKNYTFAMNGQTGKIVGNIPVHIGKAIAMWIINFILILVICSVVWMVFK